jgi:ribosomal protein S18 acetylase RimI-like enzyme
MHLEISIESFEILDTESLIEAIDRVCQITPWMSTPRFEPGPKWSHALVDVDCERHLLLVPKDRNQVVGWCRLFPDGGCHRSMNRVELGIGLLSEYQRRGLGRALVTKALNWAGRMEIETVFLTTHPKNQPAVHLFSQVGFAEIRVMNDDQIEMAYTLPSCRP